MEYKIMLNNISILIIPVLQEVNQYSLRYYSNNQYKPTPATHNL